VECLLLRAKLSLGNAGHDGQRGTTNQEGAHGTKLPSPSNERHDIMKNMRVLLLLLLAAPALSAQTAPSRFEILARSIDSTSKIAASQQMVAAEHQRNAQEASRMLFLSTMVSGFGRRPNWMNAATAIGVSQLFGSIRGNGQTAAFAGLTGGASWLLSTLVPHGPLHFRNVRIAR